MHMAVEARIDGEHRYVAALMADIVGSTEITEKIGAERGFLLVQDIMRMSWAVIEQFHGHAINLSGDGIFAIFGAPVAVEKASFNACRAAVAICERMKAEGDNHMRQYGVRPQIRIGIAGGEVLVVGKDLRGEIRPTASGSAVNLASRLQNHAPAGGIVCSAQVAADVEGLAIFENLGEHQIKGYVAVQELHRLLRLAGSDPDLPHPPLRRNARFVGRESEFDTVRRWARDRGGPAVCLIEGEAGIGKTRLIDEVLLSLGPGRIALPGNCTADSATRPLFALSEILKAHANWQPGQPRAALQAELAGLAGADDAQIGPLVDVVGGFAAAEAESGRDIALDVRREMIRCIAALAVRADRIIVIEDWHWVDPLTAGVMKQLLEESAAGTHFLITSRPLAGADLVSADIVMCLPLQPLTRDSIALIATSMLDELRIASGLVDLVTKKSEGNPFFATEILRHLAGREHSDLSAAKIGTIQNLVFVRFDRLDAETKETLRLAATIGRSFPFAVLQAAGRSTGANAGALLERAAGLVQPVARDPENSGQFSHVLLRDTIYGSIPSSHRAALHLQVAEAIEKLEKDRLPAVAETLADHYERAGRPREAVAHLHTAAQNAFRIYSLETCDEQLARAFAMIDAAPDAVPGPLVGALLELWARCLDEAGNYAKLIARLQRWMPVLEKYPVDSHFVKCLALKAKAHCHGASFARSLEIADTAIKHAEALGDVQAIAFAKVISMRVLTDSGLRGQEAVDPLFKETRAVAESGADLQLTHLRLYHQVSSLRARGQYRAAKALNDELYALAKTTGDSHMMVIASWSRGLLSLLHNDIADTLPAAEESLKYSIPGTTHWRVAITLQLSAKLRAGQEVPLAAFQAIIDKSNALGDITLRNTNLFNAVLWQFLHGHIRRGWRGLRQLEQFFHNTGSDEGRKLLPILRAEILLNLAGLLPSGRPRPKLALGDMLQVIVLRLRARAEAESLLRGVIDRRDSPEGFFQARANAGLAVLARARREMRAADELFDKSIAIYEAENLLANAERVRRLRGEPIDLARSAAN